MLLFNNMEEIKEIKNYTNNEILTAMKNLSANFEKVKSEIIMLHEILVNIEKQYLDFHNELEQRR